MTYRLGCCCLGWHLATQILYFIGVGLLLLCEIYARAQLCCMQRKSVYRTLGIILLVSCKYTHKGPTYMIHAWLMNWLERDSERYSQQFVSKALVPRFNVIARWSLSV